ncbi:hypothetical protein [Sphingomonas sp. PR090111-T3T-6A]|uniref:hypothetical protein n=1 Tax=Sphingomonas sp. PR090111-T3T-6A TaxID=685778 RepID=UPI00037CC9E7|nr:hypothetical protein [Sphingomonas sp. PR090111-T3T-6A]
MALFALWHEEAVRLGPPSLLHERLRDEAHVVPDRSFALPIATRGGVWQLAAFATDTHFYRTDEQVWTDPEGGACVIHGVLWRQRDGVPSLVSAAEVARLLERPGQRLPDDVTGEYAVARLHPCGTLTAFSDPRGLHQLFRRTDNDAMVASRAAFLALLGQDWTPEPEAGLWLSTIGYRVGRATAWRNVRQLAAPMVVENRRARHLPPAAILPVPGTPRGFEAEGSEALLERGLEEARAAALLGAGDGIVTLPITGGKDSRAVLAICLAAGLRDRLQLFTRGPEGHPDVEAGRLIAARIGVPHRRETAPGLRARTDWDADMFHAALARLVYQTDGGMGGWDLVSGTAKGATTTMTGHLGEVLKAYAKGGGDGVLDPVAMIRLQAPFDPLELLRPEARAAMVAEVAAQMDAARAEGAEEADLPDLFYLRNRVPNWLGGIRGIKSFEQQPIMPLGVDSLQALAFRLTAGERRQERLHFEIVRRLAPELLDLPFAHQSWNAALPNAPQTPPLLAAPGLPLFGNWQHSVNYMPRLRAWLSDLFRTTDVALWDSIDRERLLAHLRDTRFDYFGLIGLLGLTAAVFHGAGIVQPDKIGADDGPALRRPIAPIASQAPITHVAPLSGYLDAATGAASLSAPGRLRLEGTGEVSLDGWLYLPEWPGAQPALRAHVAGRTIARAAASTFRADLLAAGIGHGAYGFSLRFDASEVKPGDVIEIGGVDGATAFEGGHLEVEA